MVFADSFPFPRRAVALHTTTRCDSTPSLLTRVARSENFVNSSASRLHSSSSEYFKKHKRNYFPPYFMTTTTPLNAHKTRRIDAVHGHRNRACPRRFASASVPSQDIPRREQLTIQINACRVPVLPQVAASVCTPLALAGSDACAACFTRCEGKRPTHPSASEQQATLEIITPNNLQRSNISPARIHSLGSWSPTLRQRLPPRSTAPAKKKKIGKNRE